jgi:hypothetical protein
LENKRPLNSSRLRAGPGWVQRHVMIHSASVIHANLKDANGRISMVEEIIKRNTGNFYSFALRNPGSCGREEGPCCMAIGHWSTHIANGQVGAIRGAKSASESLWPISASSARFNEARVSTVVRSTNSSLTLGTFKQRATCLDTIRSRTDDLLQVNHRLSRPVSHGYFIWFRSKKMDASLVNRLAETREGTCLGSPRTLDATT